LEGLTYFGELFKKCLVIRDAENVRDVICFKEEIPAIVEKGLRMEDF
jgi:hypothetical protein